jgi:LysR family transcriptional regulator, regulator for bpeEF and oprC
MSATIAIEELTIFAAVVRTGSFTGAARALGTQKAHASRVVSRLERRLGVRLLQRSTRSLAVTEVGRELYERVVGILSALDETQAVIQRTHSEPQGVLRLTCGVEFGLLVVNQWIKAYLERYPLVRVEADFSDRLVDLIHEGFDLAIRIGRLADSGLSARPLGEITYALYASPGYLRARHAPEHPKDLASHELIVFVATPPPVWHLAKANECIDIEARPRLVVNNHVGARDAAVGGLGIALLPRFQAAPFVGNGTLVEILAGWTRTPAPIHALFASSRYLTPKVRAFIDLACDRPPEL